LKTPTTLKIPATTYNEEKATLQKRWNNEMKACKKRHTVVAKTNGKTVK
jgi:hypothetical protein